MPSSGTVTTRLGVECCYYGCGRDSAWYFQCPRCSGPPSANRSAHATYLLCDLCARNAACKYCRRPATEQDLRADSDIASATKTEVSSSSATTQVQQAEGQVNPGTADRDAAQAPEVLTWSTDNRDTLVDKLASVITNITNTDTGIDATTIVEQVEDAICNLKSLSPAPSASSASHANTSHTPAEDACQLQGSAPAESKSMHDLQPEVTVAHDVRPEQVLQQRVQDILGRPPEAGIDIVYSSEENGPQQHFKSTVTIHAPTGIASFSGTVCSSKEDAEKSAATAALRFLTT
eukprot:gnl/TRDRNA2_/TRDRNA2_67449_c0_seq1.p1 gnl/TRDRNA2_/TRDRNA2_67449_c0~~gnl/TRDRNA2_/TRDRNA2_67449_c0_seq1.p1  ORF type:complete len:291 (-),score=31.31 gnl/TRDRNA2_/TRDRNA2_67449_c0_seq1:371-1243(-)